MPDPTKPKQGWFAGHLQTALPGVAADATAVRPKAKAAALSDYLRAARQATGGFVEGVTRLPADIASLSHAILPAPGSPSLQTTGRGSVRSSSAPTAGSLVRAPLDQAIAGNEHLAARLGDTVAGGAAENVSDESLRGIGEFAGNIAGFEGAVRLPKMAARLAQESRLLKALSSEGGATLTAPGEAFKGSGYAVADPGLTALVSSPTEMRAFLARPGVKKALAEGKHLGKWTDPATGRTEINITDILPSREKATALGMERGEKAIGDLKAGEYQGDVALEQVRRGAGPVMDAERAVGRDAAGNVITNRGRTVRDQAPLPRTNTVPDTRTPAPVGAYGTKPARPYTGQYSHQRVASPDALPGPGRPGNALGGRADDLQAELGYDHRQPSTYDQGGIPVFHGTTDPDPRFTQARIGNRDLGIHLGTEGQANERLVWKSFRNEEAGPGRVLRAAADIKNPLRLPDAGAWGLDNMKHELRRIFPAHEVNRLRGLGQVRSYIRSKGFDGAVYRNTGEVPGVTDTFRREAEMLRESVGGGDDAAYQALLAERSRLMGAGSGDSHIAFSPDQVRIVPPTEPPPLPGPYRSGTLGSASDDLQAELGYDHRPGPPAPVAAPEAPEKVVAAGYSTLKDPKTGKHFTGFNHADARDQAKAAGLREGFLESNSGFITNRGRFVNRKEAADLALKSGQMGPKGRGRTPLLSEHVKRGELASDRASRYEYTPEEAAATGLFSPEELRAMQPPIPGPWQPTPRGVSSGMAAEPRYLYHTTDKMNVGDIADAGLLPHKPSFRGEQNAWPRAMGGSGREGRVYFGQTEEGVSPFSEPGHTTLRVRRDYAEKTGLHEEFPGSDAFTRKTIPPEYIEVKQGDKWAPLKASRLGF